MDSPGAGSGRRSPNGPGIRCHPRRLPIYQGGEKRRAKILREASVYIINRSMVEGNVRRFIGAAVAPRTNLRDAWPLQPRLKMLEHPAPAYGLLVLARRQERNTPATEERAEA